MNIPFFGKQRRLIELQDNKINRLENQLKSNMISIGSIPIDSFLGFALGSFSGRVLPGQAMKYYRENSSIATAVDLVADSFEQIDPVLRIEEGKYIDDHPIIDLLNKPNGFQTWQELAGQLSRHYLLTHDSHSYGGGNINRPPIELFSVKPQLVNVTENKADSFPGRYIINEGVGQGNYFRDESIKKGARFYDGNLKEIYHIMGFSSMNNNINGDSPLTAAALEAKQQIQGRIHNLSTLEQGGRLSLIVNFKEDGLTEDQLESRRDRIIETLGGADGKRIAVISGEEIEIKEAGKTNKDMDYVKLDEIAGQAIYLRYKIPLPLVSTKATTFNNMETAIPLLFDLAVLPNADTIFSGLSKFLLPRFGMDPAKIQITYNPDTIPALMNRRLEQLSKRKSISIETTNELRSLLPNREPIEGGDTFYQPANLVPAGEDQFVFDNIPDEPEEGTED